MGNTRLNENYTIEYWAGNTRNGFYHKAELLKDGKPVGITAKINYINRTWESYPFQTVKLGLIDKAFKSKEISAELYQEFKSLILK